MGQGIFFKKNNLSPWILKFMYLCYIKIEILKLSIMNIKSTLLILPIALFFNMLLYAQTENQYSGFNPAALKENAKYVRNFAPNNYDEKILYQCFTDMVDQARAEYRYLPKLKHDVNLDSTAQLQADYQAFKDEKTLENNAPYKTTYYRLRKYGLAGNGEELVAKAKAYMGETEYSYYDLCLALLQSLLKNVKTADVLLNSQYTYMGFGYNTDAAMKSMYVSLVLGHDRTFNHYKAGFGEKDLPYTKGQAGLKGYDEKVCKKCAAEPGLEVLSEYVSVNKNGEIYLNCDNYKELKRLIGKEGDAIVIDIVQEGQYECDNHQVDYDLYHRGAITKPITFEKLMAINENTNLKSGKLVAKIADLPAEVNDNKDLNLIVLVLKEGNRVCRAILPKHIESKGADYTEKINFLKDEAGVKSTGEWTISPEDGKVSISFPYEAKKTDYTAAAFNLDKKDPNLPPYKVNSVELITHVSPDYYQDPAYKTIQEKRTAAIKKDLQRYFPGMDIKIVYDYCWDEFKEKITQHEEYYDLSFKTLEEVAKELRMYNRYAAKALDSAYLAPLRTIELRQTVTYYAENPSDEEAFALWKFNNAISTPKQLGFAMSVENYIIKQVENGKFSSLSLEKMNIPFKKEYQTLLNNKLYAQYYKSSKLTPAISELMTKIYNLNPNNQLLLYNTTVADVLATTIKSPEDILKTQAAIDKLYTIPTIPKDRVNSLNLEFQFKIINYLDTMPATTETTALLNNTYQKIKEIRNSKLDSWKNAFKLASYFNKRNDYMYSLSLMTPFLDDPAISEDFLFSYVTIAAHREETYLSGLFTKAVKLAAEKNPTRLCGLVDKLPSCILENEEAKKVICKACNR